MTLAQAELHWMVRDALEVKYFFKDDPLFRRMVPQIEGFARQPSMYHWRTKLPKDKTGNIYYQSLWHRVGRDTYAGMKILWHTGFGKDSLPHQPIDLSV